MHISESFKQYTKELSGNKYNPLNKVDERKYLEEFASGSVDAFNHLVDSQLRFVVYVLRNYSIPDNVDIMDVIQEGNVGLMEGIKRYDVKEYYCRAFSFCFYYIRWYINSFLESYREFSSKIMDLSENNLLEDLPEELYDNIDSAYYKDIMQDIIDIALKNLTEREKLIVVLFFGLTYPYSPKTLQDIGYILDLSLEMVRNLKNSALKKIDKNKFKELL